MPASTPARPADRRGDRRRARPASPGERRRATGCHGPARAERHQARRRRRCGVPTPTGCGSSVVLDAPRVEGVGQHDEVAALDGHVEDPGGLVREPGLAGPARQQRPPTARRAAARRRGPRPARRRGRPRPPGPRSRRRPPTAGCRPRGARRRRGRRGAWSTRSSQISRPPIRNERSTSSSGSPCSARRRPVARAASYAGSPGSGTARPATASLEQLEDAGDVVVAGLAQVRERHHPDRPVAGVAGDDGVDQPVGERVDAGAAVPGQEGQRRRAHGPSGQRRLRRRAGGSSSASASTTRSNSREVQALVGAVRAGVGVLDAGDQHAGLGERLEELGDERDRAADAHVDRLGAVPGLGERGAGGVVRRAGGVDLRGLAGVDDRDGERGAPRHVRLEVARRRQASGVLGGVAGRDPHRDRRGRPGPGCCWRRRPWGRPGR